MFQVDEPSHPPREDSPQTAQLHQRPKETRTIKRIGTEICVIADTRPPSLKNFVQRCYEGVVGDETRIAIEREMKQVFTSSVITLIYKIITQRAQDGTLWSTDWDTMPLPTPLPPTQAMEPSAVKRSRFDVEPVAISIAKRLKTEPQPTLSTNPLSDSESDSMEEIAVVERQTPPSPKKKKNKNKSTFAKYGEVIGQTKDELQRRDRRMQRFSEIEARATPPRVDTPDYVRDAQIAASIVPLPSGNADVVIIIT